jgi:hypothetical protein
MTGKPKLPKHESGARSLVASSHDGEYVAFRSLAEAKAAADGVVVFEGDYGGQIYVVARAQFVRCAEARMQQLLSELDGMSWADPDGASVFFESLPVGAIVAGGMGGGVVTPELWVHDRLRSWEPAIRAVLQGERASIKQ